MSCLWITTSVATRNVWLLPIFGCCCYCCFMCLFVSNFKLKFIASIHLLYSVITLLLLCYSCILNVYYCIEFEKINCIFLSEFIWIEYKLKYTTQWCKINVFFFFAMKRVFIDLTWQWTGFFFVVVCAVLYNVPTMEKFSIELRNHIYKVLIHCTYV